MAGASLRRIASIAIAEVSRTGGSFSKRTTILVFALMLTLGVLTPLVADEGIEFDRGLYRAAVDPDAPLLPALQASRLFQITLADEPFLLLASDDADVGVTVGSVVPRPGQKGEAAVAAIRQAAKDYTFSQLVFEEDQSAAFPVRVELRYVAQERSAAGGEPLSPEAPPIRAPEEETPGATPSTVIGGGSDGGAAPASSSTSTTGFDFLPPERSVNTPETLSPPFPFRSLLLAYAFLIPMNFVVQVYAGSAIGERLGRKGEPLLASPARPWEIIAGKAIPYFALMMAIAAAIVVWIGAGWLSLLAVAPLAFAFLALEFVSAMYARSFRELTFLTVFTSVLLTIYAFLPAVFSDVHPIALVSPITLVVFDLRDQAVTLGQVLYALLPLTLFSSILFVMGAALYREEDLFHQKPVLAKAVDSVARQVRSLASGLKLSFMFLPFVFVAELLLVTFLFAWPVPVGLLGVLLAVALVEETFKAAPSYAAVRRGVVPAKRAVLFGALVGLGFFLAEKGFLLASLAGLYDVPAGAAVFGAAGGTALGGGAAWLAAIGLLLGPLLLHMTTAAISAWGARTGGATFGMAFTTAVVIHTIYNFTIVTLVGGAIP